MIYLPGFRINLNPKEASAIIMAWTVQLFALTLAAIGLLSLQLASIYFRRERRNKQIWAKLNIVGVPPGGGILSWGLAIMRSVTSMQAMVCEGYEKFSKLDKPFVLLTMWIGGALVVLPPSMLHLLTRPRDELSSFDALLENAQFQYLMTDKDVYANTIHFDIVRKELAPKNMGPCGHHG